MQQVILLLNTELMLTEYKYAIVVAKVIKTSMLAVL